MNWGPSFWRCIHYMAIHGRRDIIEKLPRYLPCEECKTEWISPEPDEDLVEWSIRLHNKVNGKLGRWDKWDRIDFNISQKPTCDICENREHVFYFPWMFFNTIADDKEFVTEFVSKYPCSVCRDSLITGVPEAGEANAEWVHRNNIRFNQARGFPEPPSFRKSIVTEGAAGTSTTSCENC